MNKYISSNPWFHFTVEREEGGTKWYKMDGHGIMDKVEQTSANCEETERKIINELPETKEEWQRKIKCFKFWGKKRKYYDYYQPGDNYTRKSGGGGSQWKC